MVTLFPDQQNAKVELVSKFREGYKRPLLVAPTGWGKGTVSADIIHDAVRKNPDTRIMFIVNRRALVKDMSKRLTRLGIYHGILMGAQTRGTHMNVLIANVQTLRNRLNDMIAPKLVFVDEAHTFMSEECQNILNALEEKGAYIVLMTATPWDLRGRGMNEIADSMIEGPQADVLMETGRLVQPVIYAPKAPDMTGVKKTREGEYDEKETAQRMSEPKLVGDMVKHWKQLASGKRTIGFATDKRTAKLYADEFNAAGIRSTVATDETKDDERDNIWQQLRNHELDVVWTVGIVSYGFDMPELEAIILARPTMSLALHLQQCGRVLRSFLGKLEGIIIDHAGNTIRRYPGGQYGLPDAHRTWSLLPRRKNTLEEELLERDELPRVCPKCQEAGIAVILKPGTPTCPTCGYDFAPKKEPGSGNGGPSDLEHDKSGELQRIESRVYIYPDATGNASHDSIMDVARKRGYNPNWAKHIQAALESARADYSKATGKVAKEYWNTKQIRSMLRQPGTSQLPLQ